MKTLDLHGLTYDKVELEVENFILLYDFPLRIITGNSFSMREIVVKVIDRHNFVWDFENHLNLGAIVINA